MTTREDVLYDAVQYMLGRIQTDPDVGWYCGWGTEAFRRLCVAEATYFDVPFEQIEANRRQDRQPPHRKREPEVVELRARLEKAET